MWRKIWWQKAVKSPSSGSRGTWVQGIDVFHWSDPEKRVIYSIFVFYVEVSDLRCTFDHYSGHKKSYFIGNNRLFAQSGPHVQYISESSPKRPESLTIIPILKKVICETFFRDKLGCEWSNRALLRAERQPASFGLEKRLIHGKLLRESWFSRKRMLIRRHRGAVSVTADEFCEVSVKNPFDLGVASPTALLNRLLGGIWRHRVLLFRSSPPGQKNLSEPLHFVFSNINWPSELVWAKCSGSAQAQKTYVERRLSSFIAK